MRLCTLNVHMWTDTAGRSNADRMIALLRGIDADVVALNEVPAEGVALPRVADALGMHHAFGAESWLGNALLSRAPLTHVEVASLRCGYEEGRCAVMARITTPAGDVDLVATHLDPSFEDRRLQQLQRLAVALEPRAAALVVMGDFNALRLADHPADSLAAVAERRARAGCEEPRGDVIARMDALGYIDLHRLALAGDVSAYREKLDAPLPEADRVTCWVGTRVDYVWGSSALVMAYAPTAARTVESDATDHRAVVVDVAPAATLRPLQTSAPPGASSRSP